MTPTRSGSAWLRGGRSSRFWIARTRTSILLPVVSAGLAPTVAASNASTLRM
ncbi:MAG: hypothetical protein OXD50_06815 [Chloroflexi bacterium]|nr:hypothetical protein [Chloroflexota bacterium]